ncbi:MAG: hypothetical protein F6K26_45595 [Moorea sp. SIO2I5]|nr:hypothetical protein [Moorena sp. SIO2I5]
MSSIKIAELRPAGSELFQDSESFLHELSDGQEIDKVLGGFLDVFVATAVNQINVTIVIAPNANFNVSYQLSAISEQLSAFISQFSALSF